jgi:hypothetical protein
MPGEVSQTYTPRVALTGRRGTYRVQSGSDATVYYTTTANSCTCPARKPCKHQRFVRRLNIAFFTKKATEQTPPAATAGIDAQLAATEKLLEVARRALADCHPQSDEYATLLRAVDRSERAMAALDASAVRAA